jgi:hypothetical protein
MTDHPCIATEGLMPRVLAKVKKTLVIATLGLVCIQINVPPDTVQTGSGGGSFIQLDDRNKFYQPYDILRKKSIILVIIDGKEYRGVIDHKIGINRVSVAIENIRVKHISEITILDLNASELNPVFKVELLEVHNEYTNKVEVKFI